MNRRKIKKEIKKVDDIKFQKRALDSLKSIRLWEKIIHKNSKSNMVILTNNFYRKGILIY